MLSLLHCADILEAGDDRMYTVDLDGGANTILTSMADDDPALTVSISATATLTIESAQRGYRCSQVVGRYGQRRDPGRRIRMPEPEDSPLVIPCRERAAGRSPRRSTEPSRLTTRRSRFINVER